MDCGRRVSSILQKRSPIVRHPSLPLQSSPAISAMLIETRMVVSTMRMTGLVWEMHSPDTFSDSHTEQSGRGLTFHSFCKVLEAGRSGFAVKSLKRFTTATKGLYSIVIWTGGRLLTQMQPIRG